MIVIYSRDPGDTVYEIAAKWEDGDWLTGEDRMSHVPDDATADQILDRFGGSGGTLLAIEVADEDDAPDTFDVAEESNPTIELDGTNWMNPDNQSTEPEEDLTPLEEMTEEEIRAEYSDERAERIIQSLKEEGKGRVSEEE